MCSSGPDKLAIHKTIKSLYFNGFVEIKVEKITSFNYYFNEQSHEYNSDANKKERRRKAIEDYVVPVG